MIAVALPAVRDEFGVGIVAVSWLVTLYLVAVAVSQPVGGRLGDAIGSLAVLRLGLVGMAVFSVGAAVAPTFPLLVFARSVQGVAAALLIPSATAFLRRSVATGELASVLGMNGAMISAGAALGPVLGGLILALAGWRWLFLVNLPAAAVVWLMLRPLSPDQGKGLRTFRADPVSLAALVTAFTGLALLGTAIRSGSEAFTWAAAALFALGVGWYAAAFRLASRGIVDLDLFRSFAFARAGAMTALSNLVMYTTLVALPVYLRDEHDLGTGQVGGLLFAMSAVNVLTAPLGGRMANRFGIRTGLVSGSGLLLLSAAGVLALVASGGTYSLAAPLTMVGAGMGLSAAAQQTSGLTAWPLSRAGSAAGTLSFMRYVGSVAGASLLAAVLGGAPGPSDYEVLLAAMVAVSGVNALLAFLPSPRVGRSPAPD